MSGDQGLANLGALAHFQWHRLLSRVRVLGSSKYPELSVHLTSEGVLGQHALDRQLNNPLRMGLLQLFEVGGLQVADVAGVVLIQLVLALVAGDLDLVRVDHDNVITGIHMRGVGGLVLAAQSTSDLGCDITQGLVFCVDQEPLPLDFGGLGTDGCLVHGGDDQLF